MINWTWDLFHLSATDKTSILLKYIVTITNQMILSASSLMPPLEIPSDAEEAEIIVALSLPPML